MVANSHAALSSGNSGKFLKDASPCLFPRYSNGTSDQKKVSIVDVKSEQHSRVNELANASEGDLESTLQTAWALVLRCYTDLEEICFGYQECRVKAVDDASPTGTEKEIFSTPTVRMELEDSVQIWQCVETAKKSYAQGLRRSKWGEDWMFERSSSGDQLFNTVMILEKRQRDDVEEVADRGTSFEAIETFADVSGKILNL